jgi:methyl-accepting chemotaxis protein
MNPEIIPEQKQQLNSWALQRDNLLGDLAVKQIENDRLTTANKELAASLTKIQEEINQSIGRLDEMTKKEAEFEYLTNVKNAELSSTKTMLETKIEDFQKEIDIFVSNKKVLAETIDTLVDVHDSVFERINDLDKNIEEARRISSENLVETNNLLIALKGEFKKLIDVNAENVEKTNVVINQLPRIIFDLQKDIFERKQFNRHKVTPQ